MASPSELRACVMIAVGAVDRDRQFEQLRQPRGGQHLGLGAVAGDAAGSSTTRSISGMISSRWWVTRITVVPCRATERTRSMNAWRAARSRRSVGSSRTRPRLGHEDARQHDAAGLAARQLVQESRRQVPRADRLERGGGALAHRAGDLAVAQDAARGGTPTPPRRRRGCGPRCCRRRTARAGWPRPRRAGGAIRRCPSRGGRTRAPAGRPRRGPAGARRGSAGR